MANLVQVANRRPPIRHKTYNHFVPELTFLHLVGTTAIARSWEAVRRKDMNILVINVYETDGASVVEFVGEGEEKITVCLDGLKSASRNELLQQAVTSLLHGVQSAEVELGVAVTPPPPDDETEQLEIGLENTFPASDPVAVTNPGPPASADPKS